MQQAWLYLTLWDLGWERGEGGEERGGGVSTNIHACIRDTFGTYRIEIALGVIAAGREERGGAERLRERKSYDMEEGGGVGRESCG